MYSKISAMMIILLMVPSLIVSCAADNNSISSLSREATSEKQAEMAVRLACEGNADELRKMAKTVDFDSLTQDGYPIFFPILLCEHEDGIRAFVNSGGDPNIMSENGRRPVEWAIRKVGVETFGLLLELGGDPNTIRVSDGVTALQTANRLNKVFFDEDTILYHLKIFDLLIEAGANINYRPEKVGPGSIVASLALGHQYCVIERYYSLMDEISISKVVEYSDIRTPEVYSDGIDCKERLLEEITSKN